MTYAAKISGTGSAFPENRVTNHDISVKLALSGIQTNDSWIRERTGIAERRMSKPGNADEFNSSLALASALKALEMAGKSPSDIDQIIYATCTPDTILPSSACWLQHKLGASKAWGVDINAACTGFVYGLSMADQFIRTGQVKNSLVIGSEVLSSIINWEDRSSCILFGDGAGAAVVERTHETDTSRILSSHLLSDGSLWNLLHVPAGGSAMPVSHDILNENLNKLRMNGKEIFKIAVRTLGSFAMKALKKNRMTVEMLDWFIPHQANIRIIEAVAKRLDLPMEKVLTNIDRYGNTSSATVPTMLDEAVRDGKIRNGHTILLDAFGSGLTYGSVLLRW